MSYVFARARFLLPISDEIGIEERISDGYILCEGEEITDVGRFTEEVREKLNLLSKEKDVRVLGKPTSEESFPMIEGILLPGFVKAHGHDHESPIIGIAKNSPLVEWLDSAVNPFTAFIRKHNEELTKQLKKSPNKATYLKARLDDISFGITTNLVHHCNYSKYYGVEVAEANIKAGTRVIVALGSQDRFYDEGVLDKTPEEATKRLDACYERYKGNDNVTIIPGPDQLFSNGPEMLKVLKAWSRERDLLFHIHSSENPDTTKWFTKKYGMTPVEYADSIGILDKMSMVAHQVNNTQNDLELLSKSGTRVVHNPLANTILGSGMPPLPEMEEKGIEFCVSTDGSGSADNQNILSAARLCAQYQRAFKQTPKLYTAERLLSLITNIPAKILNVKAGQLRKGFSADFVVVDTTKPNLNPTHVGNVMENLIWASAGNEIKYVVARGALLKSDEEYHTIDRDEDDIVSERDFNNLKQQLTTIVVDRDRIRLIKAAANESQMFSCAQVVDLVECQKYGDAQVQTAVVLYNRKCLADPENFDSILEAYAFDSDRDEVKSMIKK